MTKATAISPLRQRMIDDMVALQLQPGTQRGYIRGCLRFAAFLKRLPETATADDVRLFQLHLADSGISICSRNQHTSRRRKLFPSAGGRLGSAPLTSGAYAGATEQHGGDNENALQSVGGADELQG